MRTWRWLGILVSAFLPFAALAAQSIPISEYAARRDSLAARIRDGVVVGFGVPAPVGFWPRPQLPAFRYLTGFLEPDAAFMLVARDGRANATLFTASRDAARALFDGFPPDSAAVARATGLAVRRLEEFGPTLDSLVRSKVPVYTLRDYASDDYADEDSLTRGSRLRADLATRHPGLEVHDARTIVNQLRGRKSAAELGMLRRAIEITDRAQREAMAAIEPGMWEYEVQAVIEYAFRRLGADGPAFASIVGSGPNATQYHYVGNNRQMAAGDLVLMDIGASFGGYAADVTRTVPVNGRFTPEQRAIYQLVRDAQTAAEAVVRPGVSYGVWQGAARAVLAQGLARLGLIESPEATFDPPWGGCGGGSVRCSQAYLYMAHGLGHGIGLEVHDPLSGGGRFAPGEVFTIEPGVYVSTRLLEMLPDTPKNRAMIARVGAVVRRYENIGVRIEDDYAITGTGVERLSRAPREIEEVEAAMRAGGRGGWGGR